MSQAPPPGASTAKFQREGRRVVVTGGSRGIGLGIAWLMTAAARRTNAAYTASQGGIGQPIKALAVDWADRRIRVNAIAPGDIATRPTEPLVNDPQFDPWVKPGCPLGRWGIPKDMAWPAVFLASAAAEYMRGQILCVDGGGMATSSTAKSTRS